MTDQQERIWRRWLHEGTASLVFLGQAQWALRLRTAQGETELLLQPREAARLRGDESA